MAHLTLDQGEPTILGMPPEEDGISLHAPSFDMAARAGRRLMVFRKIAAPLMAAVSGWSHADEAGDETTARNAAEFGRLIDSTVAVNREIVERLQLDEADGNARWIAASATAEIIAAHYRATTRALTGSEAVPLIETLTRAVEETLSGFDVSGSGMDPVASDIVGSSLRALAPAASAIARFSFGRDAMELLAEVTQHLTTLSLQITARLLYDQPDSRPGESPLYLAVLEVAGEFYMESHFAEMDRLLEMPPEERRQYVSAHNKRIPMEPVWSALELRLSMIEAMTGYLPQSSIGTTGDEATG